MAGRRFEAGNLVRSARDLGWLRYDRRHDCVDPHRFPQSLDATSLPSLLAGSGMGRDRMTAALPVVTIRTATIDDLSSIVAIYNDAVHQRFATADLEPVTVEQRSEWFHEHDPATLPIYVAERERAVAGWCSLSAYRPGRAALRRTAEISYYVAAAVRGRGVGTALVRHAIEQAPRFGKHVLFGIVLERNAPSIRLLTRCGFELWGRLPDAALIDGELVSHVYYGRSV